MVDLTNQRRMAAQIMKCGFHRVYIDPEQEEQVVEAVTRADIRSLIGSGAITKRPAVGVSRGRARRDMLQRAKGKRKGHGSREGAMYSHYPRKRRWMALIRPMRRELKVLRKDGFITPHTYRECYMRAKGGQFRNVAHMVTQMRTDNLFAKPLPSDWTVQRKRAVRGLKEGEEHLKKHKLAQMTLLKRARARPKAKKARKKAAARKAAIKKAAAAKAAKPKPAVKAPAPKAAAAKPAVKAPAKPAEAPKAAPKPKAAKKPSGGDK